MIRPSITKTLPRLTTLPITRPTLSSTINPRLFSLFPSTSPEQRTHQNRIFDPIRQPNDLHSLTLLSASSNRPLITLWTATWCSSCAQIKPLLRQLIEDERIGEAQGGLGYVEVQMDSPQIGDLSVTYRVTSMPTLMAFSRQEAQFDTKVGRMDELRDVKFLREWLVREAERGGRVGGGGGGIFGNGIKQSSIS